MSFLGKAFPLMSIVVAYSMADQMRSTDVNIIMLHDILTLHTAIITLNYSTVPHGNKLILKLPCYKLSYFMASIPT